MTYLFLVIAIALLSAVGTMPSVALLALTLSICFLAFLLETSLVLPKLNEREITYEKIENITPDRSEQLMQDLKLRTGLDIKHVEIISTDFVRDSSQIKIHFSPNTKALNEVNIETIDPVANQAH